MSKNGFIDLPDAMPQLKEDVKKVRVNVRLYSVYDSKLCLFGAPRSYINDGSALREFSDMVNNSDERNPLNKHPEDYSFWFIGEYSEDTGELIPSRPQNLMTASAMKDFRKES